MGYYLAIKKADGTWDHYPVPKEVSVYVRQLETQLRVIGTAVERVQNLWKEDTESGKEHQENIR